MFDIVDGRQTTDPGPWVSYKLTYEPLAQVSKKNISLYVLCMCVSEVVSYRIDLGDNCIQIFHLGRYIVGYTVGNFV